MTATREEQGPLSVEVVPVAQLSADPSNARAHSVRNLESIKLSLERFGQQKPIVVDESGVVVAGNGTLSAAVSLGWDEVSVVRTSLRGQEASAYAIADNRTAELASWDYTVLAETLEKLRADESIDELSSGFTALELNALVPLSADEAMPDDEEFVGDVEASEPRARSGDVWSLGGHRVMCGDSTSSDDVRVLMDGAEAGVCFTSPPYAQQRSYGEAERLIPDWDSLMQGAFSNLPMSADGQVLVNLGLITKDKEWWPYWDNWISWMSDQGYLRFGWYVWDKKSPLPGRDYGRLRPQHEWVFHFTKNPRDSCDHWIESSAESKGAVRSYGMKNKKGEVNSKNAGVGHSHRCAGSVASITNAEGRGQCSHPAVFPPSFASYFIKSWHGTVYEPFCGSGSTLMACEQLGRVCYGMELDPVYVDMILGRWENMTGGKAVRVKKGTE